MAVVAVVSTSTSPSGLPNGTRLASHQNGTADTAFVHKLGISADTDTTTAVPADVANGLDVDVTRIAAGANLIGDVGVGLRTTGGATVSRIISAASTNATSVKGTTGQVVGWYLSNQNASAARYVKLYNKATAPTVGTDATALVLPVPAGGAANLSLPFGIAFSAGIALAITGGVTEADTTAVAASEVVVNLFYK